MPIDIPQLVTLVNVAELGSLSKASERMNIVQPALSRQIKLLEQELGVTLFDRHGRGMSLTSGGQEVVEHAVGILAGVEALRRSAETGRTSFRGTVRIGMTPTVADIATVPLMGVIREEHPDLSIRLTSAFTGYLLDWLRRGDLDLAVSYDPPASKSLKVQPIMVERLYFVSARKQLSLDRPVEFSSLSGQDLILPSHNHGLRASIANCALRSGVEIPTRIEADSFNTMISLTKSGFGDTILPLGPLRDALAAGTLFAAPLVNPTPERTLVLCYPADRPINQAASYAGRVFGAVAGDMVARGIWGGRVV